MRLARCETGLSPPVKYFTDRSKAVLPLWIFNGFFSVLCLLCLCARLFICALWSPAGKGLTSWLSFVVSHCEFVTFPLVSLVRCGTRLYRFLIFASLLTFRMLDVDKICILTGQQILPNMQRLNGDVFNDTSGFGHEIAVRLDELGFTVFTKWCVQCYFRIRL